MAITTYNTDNPIKGFEIEGQVYKVDYDGGIQDQVGIRKLKNTTWTKKEAGELFNSRAVSLVGKYSHAEGYGTGGAGGEASHSEGRKTSAEGDFSHAEGDETHTYSSGAHSEGLLTQAAKAYSHAEGRETHAGLTTGNSGGSASHAEGYKSTTQGDYAHAEGFNTLAVGQGAHAEGQESIARGDYSHAEGGWIIDNNKQETDKPTANGKHSHVEGTSTRVETNARAGHAEGYKTKVSGAQGHAEGDRTLAQGPQSHAEGSQSQALGNSTHAEGNMTIARANGSHAEGSRTETLGVHSHAEGYNSYTGISDIADENRYLIPDDEQDGWELWVQDGKVIGVKALQGGTTKINLSDALVRGYLIPNPKYISAAHAEGRYTKAYGDGSHAEGSEVEITIGDNNEKVDVFTQAHGKGSHAEGKACIALSQGGHAEGVRTYVGSSPRPAENSSYTASKNMYGGHAEGKSCCVFANYGHAEGYETQVLDTGKNGAHAEGQGTIASGEASHAEGQNTTASGDFSHAEGDSTKASGKYSHSEGGPTSNAVPTDVENRTEATSNYSHAEGANCKATGAASHAQGTNCLADQFCGFAGGAYSSASKSYTTALGYGATTKDCATGALAIGKFNSVDPYSEGVKLLFMVGMGTNAGVTESDMQGKVPTGASAADKEYIKDYIARDNSALSTRKNAFAVDENGTAYAQSTALSKADYAEYFLWADGNPTQELRWQKFVSLVEDKIKIAEPGEDIIGIISTSPAIAGDFALTEGKDKSEYAPVGFLGKLIVEDNGECQVGTRCTCGHGGIAIPGSDYRVIKRLDNNHILVLASFL